MGYGLVATAAKRYRSDSVKRLVLIALVLSAVALGFIYLRDRAQDNPFAHEGKDPTPEQLSEMHAAARSGDLEALKALVEKKGLYVDAADGDGRTALAVAKDANTASWLIAHGANVNAQTPGDYVETVLMTQAEAGHADVVQLLLKHGVPPDGVDPTHHSTALLSAWQAEKMVNDKTGWRLHDGWWETRLDGVE
jgi:Ankyrin repeats (3 copies)